VIWLEKGHEATKEFFAIYKECGFRSLITQLEDDQGRNISSAVEIGEQCKEFYARLYARQAIGDNNRQAKEALLSCTKDQNLVLMKRRLVAPITKEELWSVVEAMVKGKPLGLNGIIVNFFLCMWPGHK
jgi:hypothetical protein